jgi:hypothetical protein
MIEVSKWDEYLIHQTDQPISVPTEGRLGVDRFHLLAHDDDGQVLLGTGFGQYRSKGVMDSITYLVTPEEQRILRLSRHVNAQDFADAEIGGLRFEVLDPMRSWRWSLEHEEYGVSFDLRFDADYDPFVYRKFEFEAEGTTGSAYNHYIQLGRFRGDLEVDGKSRSVDYIGIRDRSWGMRAERERQGLHLWIQTQLTDCAVCFTYNEHRNNDIAYLYGAVVPSGGEPSEITELLHDIEFASDGKVPTRYTFKVTDANGDERTITYDPLLTGFIGGLGYGGWHGQDRGPYYEAVETLDITGAVEDVLATQPIVVLDQTCRIECEGKVTFGNVQYGITRSSSYQYRPTLT